MLKIIAFVLCGLGMISLLAFIIIRDKHSSKQAVILKGITSALFIATALFAGLANPNRGKLFLPIALTILGLLFGSIGDIALEFKIYFKSSGRVVDSDNMTFIGIGAFAIGHIAYIVASCFQHSDHLIYLLYACFAGLACAVGVTFVAKHFLHFNYGKFIWPVLFYSFLLSTFVFNSLFMMIFSYSVAALFIFIGSLLFIISDLILSMSYWSSPDQYQLIGWQNPESKLFIVLNFITYYFAQYLLAISLLLL